MSRAPQGLRVPHRKPLRSNVPSAPAVDAATRTKRPNTQAVPSMYHERATAGNTCVLHALNMACGKRVFRDQAALSAMMKQVGGGSALRHDGFVLSTAVVRGVLARVSPTRCVLPGIQYGSSACNPYGLSLPALLRALPSIDTLLCGTGSHATARRRASDGTWFILDSSAARPRATGAEPRISGQKIVIPIVSLADKAEAGSESRCMETARFLAKNAERCMLSEPQLQLAMRKQALAQSPRPLLHLWAATSICGVFLDALWLLADNASLSTLHAAQRDVERALARMTRGAWGAEVSRSLHAGLQRVIAAGKLVGAP